MMTVAQISEVMTTWVGIFVNNIDGKTIRELEVVADDEETAIIMLDFYEYDETWQNYSFVGIRKKKWAWLNALLTFFNSCVRKVLM